MVKCPVWPLPREEPLTLHPLAPLLYEWNQPEPQGHPGLVDVGDVRFLHSTEIVGTNYRQTPVLGADGDMCHHLT